MSRTKSIPFFLVLSSLLSLLLASGTVLGQSARPCITGRFILPEDYSAKDAKTDCQHALSLNEADSTWKKADLLYYVALFDSTSHMGRVAKAGTRAMKEGHD